MSGRRRVIGFSLLVAACTLGVAVAIAAAVRGSDPAAGESARARAVLDAAETKGQSVVLFRSLQHGGAIGDGVVAAAPLVPAPGERTRESLRCDRAYFAAGHGICLARGSGFAAGYAARLFDDKFQVRTSIPLQGIPSRARVSPDGRYGAVTLFVTGHAYADAGTFSTQTTLLDMRRGTKIAQLEQFAMLHGQRRVTAVDVNFWGVTFARDSDRFFATMATGGKTYLIEGSVRRREAHVIHENVECPSLSPDGTRIAYKRRGGSAKTPWRLTVLDLETMRETPLAETRSVDDQAEWLDDDHVLYGIDGAIWVTPADGSGTPQRFIAQADSPSVVRW